MDMKSLQFRPFVLRAVVPLVGLVLAISIAVFLLLLWSSARTNEIAIDRQENLLALVLSQSQFTIAHDQESATVWDDAVNHVKNPDSAEWIDSNLGRWMHTYFGHDAAYILNGKNEPTFVFVDSKVADTSAFQAVEAQVAPLAAKLRDLLRNPNPDGYATGY
jgi:sensor domain CHASE-containing protein